MTLSKFNQMWFDMGREARLKAQLHAYQTKTAVHLPQSSHNATAASHWRDGWNSISLDDIKKHCLANGAAQDLGKIPNTKNVVDPIAHARKIVKGS